jgi:hypothetical protein
MTVKNGEAPSQAQAGEKLQHLFGELERAGVSNKARALAGQIRGRFAGLSQADRTACLAVAHANLARNKADVLAHRVSQSLMAAGAYLDNLHGSYVLPVLSEVVDLLGTELATQAERQAALEDGEEDDCDSAKDAFAPA